MSFVKLWVLFNHYQFVFFYNVPALFSQISVNILFCFCCFVNSISSFDLEQINKSIKTFSKGSTIVSDWYTVLHSFKYEYCVVFCSGLDSEDSNWKSNYKLSLTESAIFLYSSCSFVDLKYLPLFYRLSIRCAPENEIDRFIT